MRRVVTSNRLMATIESTTSAAMASSLAAPSSGNGHKNSSSGISIASSLFGGSGGSKQQQANGSSSSSRKSSTKEKRWRQKEDERVEKLRLLVSYLRNGSSQQLLVKPVKLEADEIELAQRYKSLPTLCENCLKSMEMGGGAHNSSQLSASAAVTPNMDPMPPNGNHHACSVSSCSIMNLSDTVNGGSSSQYSICSRTPEWNHNQNHHQMGSLSGCSSHKQLNTSQSSAGIVINVRRSSEQSECLASASDTDSHHNQQLTSAESDQTGSTYSGSSGSTTNLQAALAHMPELSSGSCSHSPLTSTIGGGGGGPPMAAPVFVTSSSAIAINGPSSSSSSSPYHQSPPKMFYIGDCDSSNTTNNNSTITTTTTTTRRDGCAWTNPPNLATWIDNEVNSLVHDLEAKSQLARNEKSMKSSKRKWLPSSSSSNSTNNRRSSSGAQST